MFLFVFVVDVCVGVCVRVAVCVLFVWCFVL